MDVLIWIKTNIPLFLVYLTLLVFVHEMGHYLLARRNGVRIEVFSIGFGAELFGWTDRRGTRWKFSAVPLGGYVKMFGDADPASVGQIDPAAMSAEDRGQAYQHKRVGQRAAIAAAGPAANFLFAIAVLAALYSTAGQPYTEPVVNTVTTASAAEAAGLMPGDRVVSIDGTSVDRFEDMQRIVLARPGQGIDIDVRRGDRALTLHATPTAKEVKDRFGNVTKTGLLGVTSTTVTVVRYDPATAVWQAARETWVTVTATLHELGQIVAGARSTDELGGVLRIADMSGQVTRAGLVNVVSFLALLSINLGLINLFPIPVLDGGHLLFYAAEAVRGRPLSRRIQEMGSMAGLAAVLALMVFATWNDLVQLRVVAFFASLIS